MTGIKFAAVGGVEAERDAGLAQVVPALSYQSFLLRCGESRQKQGGENRDDGDDHEQFDEGESFPLGRFNPNQTVVVLFHRAATQLIKGLGSVNENYSA